MAKQDPGKRQAEAAREALRNIEKAKLELEAIDTAAAHFGDFAVNAMLLIGDLATDAIRRAEALEQRERDDKAKP